jgi:hypothetical protein
MLIKWKLVSVSLDIVLILAQDRCTVCTDVPYACKSLWAHPIKLLGDVGQVEVGFSLSRDSVNLSARWVHGLRRTYHRLENHFGCTRWYSYMTWVKWKLLLVSLEMVLIST